jgi:hypothetical protein
MLSYDYSFAETQFGYLSAGLQWGARLGVPLTQVPPFGIRGLVAPILRGRHFFTSEWIGEAWLAPAGVLYQFQDFVGYVLNLGTMLGVAGVWHPGRLPLAFRLGVMVVAETLNPGHSEVYGPLLGIGVEL